jgi:adenylylsulfate kinase-like enzyme
MRGAVVWLTGLPGSGKSTLARALEHRLFSSGGSAILLDGDMSTNNCQIVLRCVDSNNGGLVLG